ncbi:MAG: 3-oxoacyl-[acyl-carrier-protein] synthase [Thermoleophilaceae bacterium]|nr:3-oxoacyl-[acyl-carrier-protein] synthase [Thermoleophilaceae bacterium]
MTPLGVGARTLHERWSAGSCAIENAEGACTDFDPAEHMSKKEARRADRFTQLGLTAADEALRDAGWLGGDELPYDPARVGCIIGTGIGGLQTIQDALAKLDSRGPTAVPALCVPTMMGNAGAAAVSLKHGLLGPTFGVVSACAAGAHAIGTAMRTIQTGDADAVVAGGAEAGLTPLARAAFSVLEATSTTGISRPFDVRRDGFILGEGSGVLILEDAESAERRGARILARLRGYAATSDAHHLTAPPADGRGAAAAMRGALADAGLDAADVDYINAHGTSTPLNDRAETAAITAVLGARAGQVPVSSTKSAIGHLLGAAGAVEAAATVLALRDRVIPPTLGWAEREEGMDLDYVPDSARPLDTDRSKPAVALSNSFGFGGHNAVLCIEAAAA